METKYKIRVCTISGPLSHLYYSIYVYSYLNLHKHSFLINRYNRYPRKRLTKRLIEKLIVSNVFTKVDFIDQSDDITILEYYAV